MVPVGKDRWRNGLSGTDGHVRSHTLRFARAEHTRSHQRHLRVSGAHIQVMNMFCRTHSDDVL